MGRVVWRAPFCKEFILSAMNSDFYDWIEAHKAENPSKLRLKYGKERASEILQIEMRQKHSSKFAETFLRNPHFIFPNSLAAEQSTSDLLALFHSSLVQPDYKVADLTAGLGIDAMAFARRAKSVVAIERNEEVADSLRRNSESLGNIKVINGDCRDIVDDWAKSGESFDVVFVDPARRDAAGGRVFALKACEPNILDMLPILAKITPKLIAKVSPMLDITQTIRELEPYTEQVIALGTSTECKELVAICDLRKTVGSEPLIRAVTVGVDFISEFCFTRSEEASATTLFGVPMAGDYIYDPYPAVMKTAPHKLLGYRFNVVKIGSNTHLWFSKELADDFPGNTFRILEVLPYMSKHIKRYSSRFPKVSVTARNFDISSDALRAKLGVSDGPLRLFAVNAFDGRKLLITCEKIS